MTLDLPLFLKKVLKQKTTKFITEKKIDKTYCQQEHKKRLFKGITEPKKFVQLHSTKLGNGSKLVFFHVFHSNKTSTSH
jgi:hypothetical protein